MRMECDFMAVRKAVCSTDSGDAGEEMAIPVHCSAINLALPNGTCTTQGVPLLII